MTVPRSRLRHRPLLLAEALATLVTASLALRLLPFRRLAARGGGDSATAANMSTAQAIRNALNFWGELVPWRALCFERGLAARTMLRRRGLAATLYYGARNNGEGKLEAHVWVRSGARDVVGCEIASEFSLLASF